MSYIYYRTYYNGTKIATHRGSSANIPKIRELRKKALTDRIDYVLLKVVYPDQVYDPTKTVHEAFCFDKKGQIHFLHK